MIKSQCHEIIYKYKADKKTLSIPQGKLITIPFDFISEMKDCAVLLSKWRIENPSLSPARFKVTVERTEKWLQQNVLENDERILFMIYNPDNGFVGHIGISDFNYQTNTIRIDSVLRGVKGVCPGIMRESIEALKEWTKIQFDPDQLDLVVLSDNDKAIDLYKQCGFTEKDLVPLRKVERDGDLNWVEDPSLVSSEKYFLKMVCCL